MASSVRGQRFSNWTVLRDAEVGGVERKVWCRCDCGNERAVKVYLLLKGRSNACHRDGCTLLRRAKGCG